jgi:anthranilate phosphoribosyltransferase
MIKEAIVKIVNKQDLTYDEAYSVMNEIMSGETTPTQNAAFLASLSTKSARAETTNEIAGCAAAMRDHATKVQTDFDVFEIVGTGGDNAHSFNISTTSALVAAAGGMKVAKHGNRAASSACGTADCLEALGVNIEQSPEKCRELLDKVGMCFFFAQKYHSSMKYVGNTVSVSVMIESPPWVFGIVVVYSPDSVRFWNNSSVYGSPWQVVAV